MDDIFNTTPNTDPASPENKAAEEIKAEPAPQATTQTAFSQPPVYQQQYSSAPYNASANASAQNRPYNSAYGNTPNQVYGSAPQQSGTISSGFPPKPEVQITKGQKKKTPSLGKIVFIAIICISIVLSSVAIGMSAADKELGSFSISGNKDNNGDKILGEGAQANAEDSPISYSEYSGNGTMSPEQVYQTVKEINVGVLVYTQNQMAGEGSGIIVGKDKTGEYTYILTAAHVISDSNIDVQVQFYDETEAEATVVGIDTKTDIGVLRVKKTGFKAATFGNSDKLSVGQTVYAIGNPGGTEFFGSFTSGMISAIDRPIPSASSTYDLPCIQHNAAINPGNSGGALVNEYGQVIGLNSSKISSTEYEGMGFAVPSETVLEVYESIVKYGYVSGRPMLGIQYVAVYNSTYASIAWRNDIPYGSVVIASVNEASDMINHGIKAGDIITAVNGKEMDTTDILLEAIENAKIGDKLELTICRLGNNGSVLKTFNADVALVEDTGNNTVVEETTQLDPFSYFEGFGY